MKIKGHEAESLYRSLKNVEQKINPRDHSHLWTHEQELVKRLWDAGTHPLLIALRLNQLRLSGNRERLVSNQAFVGKCFNITSFGSVIFELTHQHLVTAEQAFMFYMDEEQRIKTERAKAKQLESSILAASPRCSFCGNTESLGIDHEFPLAYGGSSILGNLQVLCKWCNWEKNAYYDFENPPGLSEYQESLAFEFNGLIFENLTLALWAAFFSKMRIPFRFLTPGARSHLGVFRPSQFEIGARLAKPNPDGSFESTKDLLSLRFEIAPSRFSLKSRRFQKELNEFRYKREPKTEILAINAPGASNCLFMLSDGNFEVGFQVYQGTPLLSLVLEQNLTSFCYWRDLDAMRLEYGIKRRIVRS